MAAVKKVLERARRAVGAKATYRPGFYGSAETPAGVYRGLDAVLSGEGPGRRRALIGATDRSIELSDAHIHATAAPDLQPWQSRDPGANAKGVAAHCGEFLLATGAALLLSDADDEAHAWIARMSALLEPRPPGADRREMILHEAAAYALVAAGGLAWRHGDLDFLARVVAVYREHYKSVIYLPLLGGHSTRSAEWMSATVASSTVLTEAEPWVSANSEIVTGLVSGLALLTQLGWTPAAERDMIAADAANFDGYPALVEPYWGWFSVFGQRCRESPPFAKRLGNTIPVTSEGDLQRACKRLDPLLNRLIRAVGKRDVDLRSADRGGQWQRWIDGD
jgi:hypothetical protein